MEVAFDVSNMTLQLKLRQGKLNIVPGRISNVGPEENLGCLLNKLDFYWTNGILWLVKVFITCANEMI